MSTSSESGSPETGGRQLNDGEDATPDVPVDERSKRRMTHTERMRAVDSLQEHAFRQGVKWGVNYVRATGTEPTGDEVDEAARLRTALEADTGGRDRE